jgi:acetylornithine/N-succinyldiaminopimelate aminotransferase
VLVSQKAAAGMVVGTHGTTYGGNPLAMAVGEAVFDVLNEPEFLAGVRQVANYLGQQLHALKDTHQDLVLDVRGKGLLRGIKLAANPKAVQGFARDRKLLVGVAGDNVVRLAPPLIITEEHVREAVCGLDAALGDARRAAG